MASIKQRGKSWYVQIRKKNFKPVFRTFDRKADAEEWARKTETEMDSALWQDTKKSRNVQFSDLLLRYAEEVAKHKRSGVSQVYRLNSFALEANFQKPLSAITPEDITAFKNKKIKEGLAASSIRSDLSILSSVFKHARREWHFPLTRNPASVEEVSRPTLSPENERKVTSTDEEITFILSNSTSVFLAPFVWLLLETACRRSDLCRLRWECVDLDCANPTAHFRGALTKNEESRTVPLSPKAVLILRGLPTPHKGPVFKGPRWTGPTADNDGTLAEPLRADSVTQAWIRARERASNTRPELREMRLHDQRHTAVTRLVEDTCLNRLEVSAISGHKDLRSLKRYFNPDGKKISNKLGWGQSVPDAQNTSPVSASAESKLPTIRFRKEGERILAWAQTADGVLEAEGANPKEAKDLLLALLV